MNYVEFFWGSLSGSKSIFMLAREGKARLYVIGNILILGVLFGLSDMAGIREQTPEIPLEGKFALITPALFSITGIFTMLVAVFGITLVYWAAAKAFGGPGGLGTVLDLIGLSLPPFWLLAPILNYTLRFHPEQITRIYFALPILVAFIWASHVLRQGLITGQGLSPARATTATIALWVFSISAVYVFLP